jgi:hypothetical protein
VLSARRRRRSCKKRSKAKLISSFFFADSLIHVHMLCNTIQISGHLRLCDGFKSSMQNRSYEGYYRNLPSAHNLLLWFCFFCIKKGGKERSDFSPFVDNVCVVCSLSNLKSI